MSVVLKGCERCGGDLLSEMEDGEQLRCIQCGARKQLNIKSEAASETRLATRRQNGQVSRPYGGLT